MLDFGDEAVPGAVRPERVPLRSGAWIDVQRGWLAGSAPLFARLAEAVPWRAERRRMYDRTVDVPRLLCFYGEREPLPDPALDACRDALTAHYAPEPGARAEARAPVSGLRREGARDERLTDEGENTGLGRAEASPGRRSDEREKQARCGTRVSRIRSGSSSYRAARGRNFAAGPDV